MNVLIALIFIASADNHDVEELVTWSNGHKFEITYDTTVRFESKMQSRYIESIVPHLKGSGAGELVIGIFTVPVDAETPVNIELCINDWPDGMPFMRMYIVSDDGKRTENHVPGSKIHITARGYIYVSGDGCYNSMEHTVIKVEKDNLVIRKQGLQFVNKSYDLIRDVKLYKDQEYKDEICDLRVGDAVTVLAWNLNDANGKVLVVTKDNILGWINMANVKFDDLFRVPKEI